ncbi:MAG: lanthionine synthetase C family protein [Bacteroidetes bacterium]|nr:lanthionine synthetase C family protein [Bacteroidota bacterium]
MAWTPLITDRNEAERIEVIIYKIMNGIGRTERNGFNRIADATLMYGKFGLSLLNAYVYRYSNDQKFFSSFNSIIEDSLDMLSLQESDFSFGKGYAGFAWCLQHLVTEQYLDADIDELLSDVSDLLLSFADENLESGDYDFMLGGLGPAIYLLERARTGYVDPYLSRVVAHLRRLAISPARGEYYWEQIIHDGPRRVNLGIAHGIPGLMVIISKCYRLGIQREICRDLVGGAWTYLQRNQFVDGRSCFSYSISEGQFQGETALRWCYGDIGISIALLLAGQNMGWQQLSSEGIRIGLRCVQRLDNELSFVEDAHICHGVGGIAHVLNRMYQYTGLEPFRSGALYCLQNTIRRVISIEDYITFKAYKGDFGEVPIDGLMEGSAGIALCLLAMIDTNEPRWDNCFLLS